MKAERIFTEALTLRPGERVELKTPRTTTIFRPADLLIKTEDGFAVMVTRLDVGRQPCLVNDNPLVSAVFGDSSACVCYPTIAAGIEATLGLHNVSDKPQTVSAKFAGHEVDPKDFGSHPLDLADRYESDEEIRAELARAPVSANRKG